MRHLAPLVLLLACGSSEEPEPFVVPTITEQAPPAPAPAEADPVDPVASEGPDGDADGDAATEEIPTLGEMDLAGLGPPTEARVIEYSAVQPKSVLELQQWRLDHRIRDAADGLPGVVLTDIQPAVHEWFLVTLERPRKAPVVYHLENHAPNRVRVVADPDYTDGIVLRIDGEEQRCELWSKDSRVLELARASGRAYAPLCGGRLSLRNPVEGRRSSLELTTDFLRDKVWGGEQITAFVRETVYQDSELATSEILAGDAEEARGQGFPEPARVAPAYVGKRVIPTNLGLPFIGSSDGTTELGRWYRVRGFDGMFVSAAQPVAVHPEVTEGWQGKVHALDEVEATALAFFVAFDLDQHELRFDNGTDHARVGWSERARPAVIDSRLPGPDGFDTLDPLVRTGKVNPGQLPRVVATFTGGFKRSHGAFKSGELGQARGGSHYGFIEHGVVESKLMPGLSTLVGWVGGKLDVVVWDSAMDERLDEIAFARQNGVPLTRPDASGRVVPGELVTRWTDGNWSGSAEGKLRSVRASVCIQDTERGRFLLYGYFSSATPSAMARVLAAYGCKVGMLTDMNALEHTYLSTHHMHEGVYDVHHLIEGMDVLDRANKDGQIRPRFVGLADNRDFFTVLRKDTAATVVP